ncbi:hypothetical protein D934_09185 [Xylella fastidiosa subsp. sandyi Ann-1]|uniref:Uncharacterized protein n=1 Tax=Xylella fastidiosa subsp. sandyi Ann-1 TaxID=155920 RepID=A0A060HEU2_XYLFS|nr:hypothetical protein D934_09185 [Xylella fastidiosa subsp. sandyi Ann-1]
MVLLIRGSEGEAIFSFFFMGRSSGGDDKYKDASKFDDQGRGYSRSCFEPLSVVDWSNGNACFWGGSADGDGAV